MNLTWFPPCPCLQYEREMQRPLRNLVGGELVRALLIQARCKGDEFARDGLTGAHAELISARCCWAFVTPLNAH